MVSLLVPVRRVRDDEPGALPNHGETESPWVEAMALRAGSGPLLTVEFGKIISDHPMLSTMVPGEFTESFLNGEIEPFDFAISFSSLEHDGLGALSSFRYLVESRPLT